jgi:radical SAM superfamily enzyme YgiQ (UPF0313 family)
MLNYDYPLFRPPAEADNLILQVTLGCSHNNCSFCSMYKTKKYSQRSLEDIFYEIDSVSNFHIDIKKIFLADGDALSMDSSKLLKILQYLKRSFPSLRRVSCYASAQNILTKSDDELKELYENGLKLLYYGIETGDEMLLKKITKGVNRMQIIDSLNKASTAGMKISATVILGLGGKEHTKEHIKNTADIINKTSINYLSTLQLGLEDEVKKKFYSKFENFVHLDDSEILNEQKRFLEQIDTDNKIIFRSNHASNAFHLAGNLPKDKEKLLKQIKKVLAVGESIFIPKRFRGF